MGAKKEFISLYRVGNYDLSMKKVGYASVWCAMAFFHEDTYLGGPEILNLQEKGRPGI